MPIHLLRRSALGATALLIGVLAAACSAGGVATSTPPSAVPTAALATAAPAASVTPTPAPASGATGTPAPTGGRYGGGGSSPTPGVAVVVRVGTTMLGSVLVGPTGHVLYTRGSDGTDRSTCSGGCLAAWPPLLVTSGGSVAAGSGVNGKLGSFTRSNGTRQVTYKGLPLYYYVGDSKGTVNGQGIGGFAVAKP